MQFIMTASHYSGLFLYIYIHKYMKVVSLKNTSDEVEPQRSPPIKLEVTESPPTPSLHLRQEKKKRLSELNNKAAAYQNPEVRRDIAVRSVTEHQTLSLLILCLMYPTM